MSRYIAPTLDGKAFTCPLCHTLAQQYWHWFYYGSSKAAAVSIGSRGAPPAESAHSQLRRSFCSNCQSEMIWHGGAILYPTISKAPAPNEDLRGDIRADYLEAASIAGASPRGAAALLRLCVQKLCNQLGERGDNINDDIARLVRKGLPVELQQALDTVRVVGNNAVHPGEIDLKDDADTVGALFVLINAVADRMLTQPRKAAELYGSLPESIREKIAKRDGQTVGDVKEKKPGA